jgi:hypothetical protein
MNRRKRRRPSKSEPPSYKPVYRGILDLPQEVFHQILSYHTEPKTTSDNARTLLAVAYTCRQLHGQTLDFASSVLISDYKILSPTPEGISALAHLTRQMSSVCVHCTTPVLQFRREPFSQFTCCTMCDSRFHTKISELRAMRDYHLSKKHLSTLDYRTFEEYNPTPMGSPSRQNSPEEEWDDAHGAPYSLDDNNKITVYLEADVVNLASTVFHRPIYPTLRTTRGLDENWAILHRTFEQNGIFITPAMYSRWTTRKKASHHHIARDIKLLQTIFHNIPFPDRLYNLWWSRRLSGWMAMNLASSMDDDDTRVQFHELFERTFNRNPQTRHQILAKWERRSRVWDQRARGGTKDEPWNVVHFPAYISSTLVSSPGTAAAKKKLDRENALLWEKYLVSVSKFTCVVTNFEFVVDDPDYWTFVGVADSRVSLETMIERCLELAHQVPVYEGKFCWKALCPRQNGVGAGAAPFPEQVGIGSRLRYGRGQRPVVHHFGGVIV